MLKQLTTGFEKTLKYLRGKRRLSEKDVEGICKKLKKQLIAADCSLESVKAFISEVKAVTVGQEFHKSRNAGEVVMQKIHQALHNLIGAAGELNTKGQSPCVYVFLGSQGVGKTTTVAKVAKKLKSNASVLLVSTDTKRPGAIEQLKILAEQIDCDYFAYAGEPLQIATAALQEAKNKHYDYLLVDTAGRTHTESKLMDELATICNKIQPLEKILVLDALMGQDAFNLSASFKEGVLPTSLIFTKFDADPKGGAVLTARQLLGIPVVYLGTGEQIDALEQFNPDRLTSRILGSGDLEGLFEKIQQNSDPSKIEEASKNALKGRFTLKDFQVQIEQMETIGIGTIMDSLPGMMQLPEGMQDQMAQNQEMQSFAPIIKSISNKEKENPELLLDDLASRRSRRLRIAKGSGTSIEQVNKLLKAFVMVKKYSSKSGLKKMMNSFGHLMGNMSGK